MIAFVALLALALRTLALAGDFARHGGERPDSRDDRYPHAPTHLEASAVSASQIRLSWSDKSRNETGFTIERAPNRRGHPERWSQIASVSPNVTTYLDARVSANRSYWYRVRVRLHGHHPDERDYSNLASAKTLPLPPSNLSATAVSTNQIDLAWRPDPGGQDGFKIERAPDNEGNPGAWTQVATARAHATTFRDGKLEPGTTYWYRVRAYNCSGNSEFSNAAAATTLQPPCPSTIVQWGESLTNLPSGMDGVVAVAAGIFHNLALKNDGTVMGWGNDSSGASAPPTNLAGVVVIAAGGYHSLALKNDGTVIGWGDDDYHQATPPVGLSNVVAIATGLYHSLALRTDGTVVGWGYDDYGQATPPAGLSNVVAVAAGGYHSLVLNRDGTVFGWGDDADGQATAPAGLSNVVAVAAGYSYSLALINDGTVAGWGSNSVAQVMPPTNLTGVAAIAAGGLHGLALKNDGTLVGWGWDNYGQATPPLGLTHVTAIAAGYYHSLALTLSPAPPTAVTATITAPSEVGLSWSNNSSGRARVRIERAPDTNGIAGTWEQIGVARAGATNYSDATVTTGATYWYRVYSSNYCGESIYTDPVSIRLVPPAAPSGLAATVVGMNQVLLSWADNSSNESGFTIERAEDSGGSPGTWSLIATVGPDATSYTDSAATTCTSYWYRVTAFNPIGEASNGDPASATIGPPNAPSNLTATVTDVDRVDLSWVDISLNEAGFTIQRADDAGGLPGTWVQIATVGGGVTAWSDAAVTLNNTYWYRVRASNPCGDSSDAAETSALVAPPPVASNLTATAVAPNQIKLSWTDNSTDETGFKVERSLDGSNFTQIAQLSANTTSYLNTGLFPDTSYYYRVRAYKIPGGSAPSNVAGATTPAPPCPMAVAGWGMDTYGQVTPPQGLTGVVAVSAGYLQSLALKNDGTVVGWGYDYYATPPKGLTGILAVSAGLFHSLALKGDGTVVGWGDDSDGQATSPVGLTNVVAISAGYFHSLALQSDGTVVGWGDDSDGQATPPVGLTNVVAISAGYFHSLALQSDGTVVGWGDNGFSQARPPVGLTGVVAIAAGGYHSLALKSDGTVVGWGANWYGQTTPPTGLTGVTAVTAGLLHSLALKSDGTVAGWGYNDDGEATTPPGLGNTVAIASGGYHNLAVTFTPLAPTALSATPVAGNQIDLSWSENFSGVEGFEIERAPDVAGNPGTWVPVVTVGAGVTTYRDQGAGGVTTDWYRVRAFCSCGKSFYSGARAPVILLDDTWSTGTRTNQDLPTSSAWWASCSTCITSTVSGMTLAIGGSSVMAMTYFTPDSNSPPVQLNVGDTLTATFEFVFDGIPAAGSSSQGFRIGLFDFADGSNVPKRVSSDGFSGGAQGLYVSGYALFGKMYGTFKDETPIDIRKRTTLQDVSLLGTSGDYTSLAKDSLDTSAFAGFTNLTPYSLQFILHRTGLNSMAITVTWSNMVTGATAFRLGDR